MQNSEHRLYIWGVRSTLTHVPCLALKCNLAGTTHNHARISNLQTSQRSSLQISLSLIEPLVESGPVGLGVALSLHLAVDNFDDCWVIWGPNWYFQSAGNTRVLHRLKLEFAWAHSFDLALNVVAVLGVASAAAELNLHDVFCCVVLDCRSLRDRWSLEFTFGRTHF